MDARPMRTTVEGAALVGFLSVATICVSWITAANLYTAPALSSYLFGIVPDRADIAVWQAAGLTADSVNGTRLEAVLIMSTTTVGRLSGAFDRPFVVIGYTLAAVMMLAPLPNEIFIWIFPLWVAVVSSMMLIRRHRFPSAAGAAGVDGGTSVGHEPA